LHCAKCGPLSTSIPPLPRCFGTFANYLGHLRGACHALGLAAPPVGHGAVKRAMVGIVKRQLSTPRPKHFIDRCLAVTTCERVFACGCVRTVVTNMVLAVQRGLEDQTLSMLWLVSYTFLLRLPSEVGACIQSPGIDLCLCVGRRYPLARPTLTILAPPRSSH
jgi:hypothetical protein